MLQLVLQLWSPARKGQGAASLLAQLSWFVYGAPGHLQRSSNFGFPQQHAAQLIHFSVCKWGKVWVLMSPGCTHRELPFCGSTEEESHLAAQSAEAGLWVWRTGYTVHKPVCSSNYALNYTRNSTDCTDLHQWTKEQTSLDYQHSAIKMYINSSKFHKERSHSHFNYLSKKLSTSN